ncbi:hypothetical protein Anapl_15058 [Anas platyrhynchos]|uniref:Uncharacterized protein n=1 Tax=Anas platyrhynchos TaxID=8839 RepID=R0L9Z3_ANAPL|nr:hypothetical protein Anapl_15058 [Anas platyrhynchos]
MTAAGATGEKRQCSKGQEHSTWPPAAPDTNPYPLCSEMIPEKTIDGRAEKIQGGRLFWPLCQCAQHQEGTERGISKPPIEVITIPSHTGAVKHIEHIPVAFRLYLSDQNDNHSLHPTDHV